MRFFEKIVYCVLRQPTDQHGNVGGISVHSREDDNHVEARQTSSAGTALPLFGQTKRT